MIWLTIISHVLSNVHQTALQILIMNADMFVVLTVIHVISIVLETALIARLKLNYLNITLQIIKTKNGICVSWNVQ